MERLHGRCGAIATGILTVLAGTSTVQAASLDSADGVVVGSGTISPGLGVVPAPQTITFSGTLTGADASLTPGVMSDTCAFSGTSGPLGDSIAAGTGAVSGTCSGPVPHPAAL